MAVVVRALATNQLTSSNTAWMLFREFRIAIANGLALGVVGALKDIKKYTAPGRTVYVFGL